jgi:hypothetical protein
VRPPFFARLSDAGLDTVAQYVVFELSEDCQHPCQGPPAGRGQIEGFAQRDEADIQQLKRIADWQLTEQAQRGALAQLVGAITGLDTSSHWCEGRTAASDGATFLPATPGAPADIQHTLQRYLLGKYDFSDEKLQDSVGSSLQN